ncbi:hypothetical protein CUMW_063590 [Citrus unshiu]|nr:hypothetical protein CUMW_063590 [Citrus unshiu]
MEDLLGWFLVFIFLISLLGILSYQLMYLTDLEGDYINPYDSAAQINMLVFPEFFTQGTLCILFLITEHWFMFLLSLPYLYFNVRLYTRRQHLVDVTEIYSQLTWEKHLRLYKLCYLIILLVLCYFGLLEEISIDQASVLPTSLLTCSSTIMKIGGHCSDGIFGGTVAGAYPDSLWAGSLCWPSEMLKVNLKLYGASEIVTLLSLIICKLYSSFFPEFRGNQNLADRINIAPSLNLCIFTQAYLYKMVKCVQTRTGSCDHTRNNQNSNEGNQKQTSFSCGSAEILTVGTGIWGILQI